MRVLASHAECERTTNSFNLQVQVGLLPSALQDEISELINRHKSINK